MLKITINKQSNGSSMNFSPLNNNLSKYLLQTFALFCLLSSLAIAETTQTEEVEATFYPPMHMLAFALLKGKKLALMASKRRL